MRENRIQATAIVTCALLRKAPPDDPTELIKAVRGHFAGIAYPLETAQIVAVYITERPDANTLDTVGKLITTVDQALKASIGPASPREETPVHLG